MKKPVLVIMAAGMGSRYGGLKQIDPIDKEGHIFWNFTFIKPKHQIQEKDFFFIKNKNKTKFKLINFALYKISAIKLR